MKITIILLALALFSVDALATITLSKNRLFFAENERADAVQLRNTSGKAMQFETRLHLVEMNENGGIVRVEDIENSAIPMLKFSPKRGVVQAGGKQVIRFSVRRPKDLEAGEYRAVLSITTSIATERPEAVTLSSRLSYNMPVIIRHGDVEASSELVNSRIIFTDSTPSLELWQTRQGNRSLFGNFTVTDNDGDQVGVLNGVAVYTSIDQRKVVIPLSNIDTSSELHVNYQEVISFGGNVSAKSVVQL